MSTFWSFMLPYLLGVVIGSLATDHIWRSGNRRDRR